jgi:hypothetical protein
MLSSFIEISYSTSSGSLVVPSQPSGITLKSGLYGRDATWNSLSWELKNLENQRKGQIPSNKLQSQS